MFFVLRDKTNLYKDMKRIPKSVAHLCQPIGITVMWEDDGEIQQLLDSVI